MTARTRQLTAEQHLAAYLKAHGYTPIDPADQPWLPREQQLKLTPGLPPVPVRLTYSRITPDGHRDYHATTRQGGSVWITHHAAAHGRGAHTDRRLHP